MELPRPPESRLSPGRVPPALPQPSIPILTTHPQCPPSPLTVRAVFVSSQLMAFPRPQRDTDATAAGT